MRVFFVIIVRPKEWDEQVEAPAEAVAEKSLPPESDEDEYSEDEESDFSLGENPNRRRLYIESDDEDEDD